jgi:hypothetical protein
VPGAGEVSAALELVERLRLVPPPLRKPRVLYAGAIVIADGHATLQLLENDPAPEPPEDPPWGPRLVVCTENFTPLPYVPGFGGHRRREECECTEPEGITARPRGTRDAPEWTRTITALERFIRGRASSRELNQALRHDRTALSYVPSPMRGAERPSPRYREEREPKPIPPIVLTKDELAIAAGVIEKKCKGQLADRAWYELEHPTHKDHEWTPGDPATSSDRLVRLAQLAIWRAEQHVRTDALRNAKRVAMSPNDAPIRLGGKTSNYIRDENDENPDK